MQNTAKEIRKYLEVDFSPTYIEVLDESHLHSGHLEAQPGKGHFAITISSKQFKDKNLIKKHRMIYASLDKLMHKIHALKIKIIS